MAGDVLGGPGREYGTPEQIQNLWQWINNGFQFGDPSDKAAIVIKDYNNYFGRNPTPQELQMALPQYQGPNGSAYVASLAQQQQAQANAPAQEKAQLQEQLPIIQDLINQQMTGQIKNLTDPNSPQYQAFAGNMNNLGITPSSGAFQAGLGATLAQDENNLISQAMGQVGLPLIGTYAQGQTTPYTQSMQQPYQLQQQGYDWQQFMEQQRLAQQLGQMAQPSGAQNIMGMASGSAQGAGSLLQGGAQAYKATYICTAMNKEGVLAKYEVVRLHDHLFKAFWDRPFKFLGYFIFGKLAVLLSNYLDVDWFNWKPLFYDRVMEENNPVKAVDLYEDAFWSLVKDLKDKLRIKTMLIYHCPKTRYPR